MKEENIRKISDLESILLKLNLDQKVLVDVMGYIKHNLKFVEGAALQAYHGDLPNFNICKHKPFTRFVVICYKLMELSRRYLKMGIPGKVFVDTIQDIKLRQELYHINNGKTGLSKDDVIWFRHLFHMHLFKLNTLQFQLFHMLYLDNESIGEEYMTFSQEQKSKLPTGISSN